MSHTCNDMQECTAEEYRRVYDLYDGRLTVFTSYSGSIPGIDGLITSWGIKGMASQLISSECESRYWTNDPDAWTYYVNKDLVDTLATVADFKKALEGAQRELEKTYDALKRHLRPHDRDRFLRGMNTARAALAKEDSND